MVGGFKATNLLQIKLYRLYIYVMNLHDVLMYVNISIVCFRNKHRENPRDPTFCLCFWIQGAPHAHLAEGIAGLRPQKNGRKKKSEPPFFKGTSAEIWRNLALNFVKLIQIVVFRCFVVFFFVKCWTETVVIYMTPTSQQTLNPSDFLKHYHYTKNPPCSHDSPSDRVANHLKRIQKGGTLIGVDRRW